MISEDVVVSEIIDISMFRVRVSVNLYPYQSSDVMSELLQVCRNDVLGFDGDEWSEIPKAGDFNVTWKAGFQRGRFFCGRFSERNPFNIPGPFYGAETDTCETGPIEAPHNVMLDEDGQEFVFCQPSTAAELRRIIGAALCDPFLGYGADGDDHWNLQLIREWWRGMEGRLAQIVKLAVTNNNTDQWVSFCTSQAESYLRRYAFFVDNRHLPTPTDNLPNL